MEGDGRKYPNPFKRFRPIRGRKGRRAYPDEEYSSDEEVGGALVQPINHKPDYNYCCGGGMVQIVNPKFLPF